jgi:lipopolysaccharide transport system permease protein
VKTLITSQDRSFIDLKELKAYTGLFKYLSLRDVMVRYKQTWVGFGWSVIRPLINIIIFGCLSFLVDKTGSFSDRFIRVSGGVIFWQLISTCITEVSNALVNNSNILTKVYFPKIILPLSSLMVCLVDFFISFIIFIVLFIFMVGMPSWQLLMLPLVLAYALVFAFSFGLLASTASVRYRDVRFILPFIVQILFYASPVFLSSTFVLGLNLPEWMKVLYQLNPLVFILNSFQYCFYGTFETLDLGLTACTFGITLLMLIFSVRYFLKFEKSFADYI